MTIKEAEKKFISGLEQLYDRDEAKALAVLVISHVCRLTRALVMVHGSEEIPVAREASILSVLKELKAGKPLQYVLGETVFYGLPFMVSSAVLIPRPETEELVDWVIGEAKSAAGQVTSILDIGTGSGCIPVALKKNLPEVHVAAIDISRDALKVARQNAILNQVEVEFNEADILQTPTPCKFRYSVIVSNPPYIAENEKEQMHPNVLQHEPHTALFVPDNNPLLFYEKIAEFALMNLRPEGSLFFEINENFGEEVVELLNKKGFRNVVLRKDLQGRDRMVRACL
ncbi:MAG TPA: peptide chain release factor N(5)-glutamine methyltransferase [Sphingobacteriaceae bacterium]